MAQFEELMGQIETDKNELFEKISNLEEENEQHLKEKHGLKVELIQVKTALADNESQLKRAREHINLLESLNTFKEEELKEFGDLTKDSENVKVQFNRSQKSLSELRQELEEVTKVRMQLEQQNIQLAQDLAKERQFSASVKQELKDIKAKYQDSVEQKKNELGLSNLAASRMFSYYKIRDSINNRLSNMNNMNVPVSFAGEESSETVQIKAFAEVRQSVAGGEAGAPNRMSLRNSVLQSRFILSKSETAISVSS